jgi:phosphoglycerate dehydrogenase-like enzyme
VETPAFLPPGPIVVAVLAPGPRGNLIDRTAAELRALDPRIEVVVEPYDEGEALRAQRARPEAGPVQGPGLTDAQRAVLARAIVALAVDLPWPVGEYAPHLRWVQAFTAGVGQLRAVGLAEAGIRLTTASGVNAPGLAEFVLARLLQVAKRLRALDDAQRGGTWTPLFGRSLAGTTIALVGLGAINQEIARLAQAFGMRVVATHRTAAAGDQRPHVDEVVPLTELRGMVADADAVVTAVPEDPTTVGLVSADLLAAMKRGSVLCNVGRGSAVDETALVEALRSGHLGAAILDVASVEPLPPGHPLWEAPRLYLSSHCAVVPDQHFENLYALLVENTRRWLRGDPLINEVSPSADRP